jgi:sulfite exporter TauE/SafE
MPDPAAIGLSAAFVAGVAGSVHCVMMCGGIAGALSMRARTVAGGSGIDAAWLYQLGRLGGYAMAGSIFGLLGNTIQGSLDLPRLATLLRFAGALLLILIAVRLLTGWNTLTWIEHLGARFWRMLHPVVRRAASSGGVSRTLLLGVLWGWLPCGLVYSMLLFAALSGDALRGGAIMLAFGLGTLPAMLTGSLLASRLSGLLRQHDMRLISGALMLLFGIWLAWSAIPSPHRVHHHESVAVNNYVARGVSNR